jgi:oxygen-dependent protoporphyrinogen oxidase
VVVGGGISGTAAAWTAKRTAEEQGLETEVLLLEREPQIGGKVMSLHRQDWLFEAGPLGYLDNEPIVDELAEACGLGGELVRASDAQSHRFVFSRGKVREVATHPLKFLTAGLVSPPGLLRAAAEPFIAKSDDTKEDESVWGFAARRLGSEFADRLIHPMVLGIFAGDAKRLSLRSAFPLMFELERDHGSLVRAQIARAKMRKRGELPPRRNTLTSFRKGLQSLPLALAERGGFDVRLSTPVVAVERSTVGGWLAVVEGGAPPVPADAVILACESWRAASLLEAQLPDIASRLREIPCPPVYVVALGYGSDARRSIPRGFGVLIPRGVGYRALGVTWDGYLFDERNPEGGLMARVLFGGSFDPEVASLDPDQVVTVAEREIATIFRLDAKPIFTEARLWNRAIPQYEIGHGARVEAIEKKVFDLPGLYLAGNALYGVAFGKAAARGAQCGRDAVEALIRERENVTA